MHAYIGGRELPVHRRERRGSEGVYPEPAGDTYVRLLNGQTDRQTDIDPTTNELTD